MKVISIKHPWAYLECAGIKDIENRTWKLPEKYKGKRVLIHASKEVIKDFMREPIIKAFYSDTAASVGMTMNEVRDILLGKITTSAIIGSVIYSDCVINHPSIWAEKTDYGQRDKINSLKSPIYNWVCKDPILFDKPILNVKGKLSFWDYEPLALVMADKMECPKRKFDPEKVKEQLKREEDNRLKE